VLPYKKGPDYIDAGWLSLAADNLCYNLDTFFMDEGAVISSFIGHSEGFDVSLIEGNRGIFDGMDRDGTYSSAALAKLLDCPIILVVDCIKTTSTIGVIVKGINDFDSQLNIAGVVLNHIATKRQEGVIRDAVEYHSGVKVFGALRKGSGALLPERHMGLLSSHEHLDPQSGIDAIAKMVSDTVDVSAILNIAKDAPEITGFKQTNINTSDKKIKIKIGAFRDRAFQFYYPDNFDALTHRGAEIVEIDALSNTKLPAIDALYIGGGFPETNAIAISKNLDFMASLRTAIEAGLPVYAECGGLMFLGRSISFNGEKYKMAGIFPLDFEVSHSPSAHGYTVVEVVNDNPFYPIGTIIKGHELHYSYVVNNVIDNLKFAFKMKRGKGLKNGMDGVIYKNVFATYTHVHALGTPLWADGLINTKFRSIV
jgi:cobyrinic acid a,c-diamide synthase